MVKFSETLAYYTNDVENCFIMLEINIEWALVFYGGIIVTTDYSLVILIIFIFFISIRKVNKEQSMLSGIMVEVVGI